MYAHSLVTSLMEEAGDRDDQAHSSQSYKALKQVIRCLILENNSKVIVIILPTIISRLTKTTQLQVGKAKQVGLQASLCGVLHIIIRKLGPSRKTNHVILRYADQIYELILSIFSCAVDDEVLREALLVVGALACASGLEFGKHVEDLWIYVMAGLKNHNSENIFSSAVSIITDICGALGKKFVPLYNEVMTIFYSHLSSDELTRSHRALIFSCIGDIALASGVHFEKYLRFVVERMEGAAQEFCTLSEEEMVEFGIQTNLNISKTCSATCQGFKNSSAAIHLMPYVYAWLRIVRLIVENQSRYKF